MVKRQIRIEGDLAFIPLTKGYVAIIDSADISLVEDFNWYAHKVKNTAYAVRKIYHPEDQSQSTFYLHQQIMRPSIDMEVDHIDGNGLDNRRSNLRIASHAQNLKNQRLCSRNTSSRRGVNKENNKWRARIMVDGRRLPLGRFDRLEDACDAYAKAAHIYHGKFGRHG